MKNLSKEVERLEAIREKLEAEMCRLMDEMMKLEISEPEDERSENAYWRRHEKLDAKTNDLMEEIEAIQSAIDTLNDFCW